MVSISGSNINNILSQAVSSAITGTSGKGDNNVSQAVTSEVIYNLFFKDIKTKSEFKKKIRKTLSSINNELKDEDLNGILDSLDLKEQPPFCASYSEEGMSKELHLEDALMRSDLYDILHTFYNRLYDEADKKII